MTHPLSGPSTGRPFFAALFAAFLLPSFPKNRDFLQRFTPYSFFYYNFVKEFLYSNC